MKELKKKGKAVKGDKHDRKKEQKRIETKRQHLKVLLKYIDKDYADTKNRYATGFPASVLGCFALFSLLILSAVFTPCWRMASSHLTSSGPCGSPIPWPTQQHTVHTTNRACSRSRWQRNIIVS
jgi:hypothetical protein